MMTDTEVLKELKVFRRMMKSKNPRRFLMCCIKYGIVKRTGFVVTGWIGAACAAKPEDTRDIAREFFLADLLED